MKKILKECNNNKIECQIIPLLVDVNDDNIDLSLLRRIKIGDLLGREAVKLDGKLISKFIQGKCILVSGAGRFNRFRAEPASAKLSARKINIT